MKEFDDMTEETEMLLKSIRDKLEESPFRPDSEWNSKLGYFGATHEASYDVLGTLYKPEQLVQLSIAFEKAAGLPSAFLDPIGDVIVGNRPYCAICKEAKNKKDGVLSCQSMANMIQGETENNTHHIIKCKAGLVNGCAPIFCGKDIIGTWVCGPALFEGEFVNKIINRVGKNRIKAGVKEAIGTAIPTIRRTEFVEKAEALYEFSKELTEYASLKSYLGTILHKKSEAEKARAENEKRYRLLYESANDGICISRASDGVLLHCNSRALELFDCSQNEFIGKTFFDFSPYKQPSGKSSRELGRENYNPAPKIRAQVFEWVFNRLDGTEFDAEVSITQFSLKSGNYHQAIIRDITSRKKAEEEKKFLEDYLRNTEKMRAIGTLAGGVAHDFNNLLMAIMANTALILTKMPKEDPAYKYVKYIEQYVEDGSNITNQILGYARGGKYSVEPTEVNELIQKTSEMFQHTRKQIIIHSNPSPSSLTINADKGQIEQVMLNLFLNAWQAMPDGGDIFIETNRIQVDEKTKLPAPVVPGDYVEISVRDTGEGMKRDIMERMYDPFFTTKMVGQGHGLGLSSAYGIIKNHNGYIYAESELGKGSTFYILLPIYDTEIQKQGATQQTIYPGAEKVLLVDDEERIADAIQELLCTLGYEVVVVYNGKDAIETLKDSKDEISLVILDLLMPGLSGEDTFIELKKLDPSVKVLLSSGYGADIMKNPELVKECNGYLQKPYSGHQLSKALREILNGGQGADMAV